MKILFAVVVFSGIFSGSLQALSKAAPSVAEGIGVRTLHLQDEKRNRPVVVELWYPVAKMAEVDVPQDPMWVHPKEMRNVPIAKGKYPLVVMSHGHTGDRRDSSWIGAELVKHGFIVASVEHHGNSWRSYDPAISLRFWERARDISFFLTKAFQDKDLSAYLDQNRIGFIGYSLGGMTGLALGGAQAEHVKQTMQACNEQIKEVEPELIEAIDFSEAHNSFIDSRIKAMVLFSPAAFVYPAKSLKEIKLPVALVASEGDEVLPFKDHAFKVMASLSSSMVKMLHESASHYVFLNPVSPVGKQVLRADLYKEEIEADRELVHKSVGQFTADFFKANL